VLVNIQLSQARSLLAQLTRGQMAVRWGVVSRRLLSAVGLGPDQPGTLWPAHTPPGLQPAGDSSVVRCLSANWQASGVLTFQPCSKQPAALCSFWATVGS